MPNRPARFTVADIEQAVRAAELSGLNWCVEILPDETIYLAQLREPLSRSRRSCLMVLSSCARPAAQAYVVREKP